MENLLMHAYKDCVCLFWARLLLTLSGCLCTQLLQEITTPSDQHVRLDQERRQEQQGLAV
jgi:hypothetical protein